MAEVSLQSIAVALIVFSMFLVVGIYFHSTTTSSYEIYDNGSVTTNDLNLLRESVNNFTGEVDDIDADSSPSDEDSSEFPFKPVGKVLQKLKGMKTIIVSIKNITSQTIGQYIPQVVWTAIWGIVTILIILLGIWAWLRYKG